MTKPLILSHAQNGEDVVLSRAFADQKAGFYIDIGACDPVEDSVTMHFYERDWHGVNVEPDRNLFEAFLRQRPRDANVCAAVGRIRGRLEFHPTGTRGHGTLDATLAASRSEGRSVEYVPTITLSDVIDCYGPGNDNLDFLKIDVEGWESEVIMSGDWSRHRPRVLLIEAVDDDGSPTHQAWEPPLLDVGYRFAMFDGLNRFYCRDEDAQLLMPRLTSPANVRDGWMRRSDVQAHEAASRLQLESDAAKQVAADEAARHAQELGTVLQRNAEFQDRVNALNAKLDDVRASEAAALRQAENAEQEAERLGTEVAAARQRYATLAVSADRARDAAAAALKREEEAEAKMATLEMEAIRHALREQSLRTSLEEAVNRAEEESIRSAKREYDHLLAAAGRDEAEAWLAAVRASTSWRVTRPVRVLIRGLRGK